MPGSPKTWTWKQSPILAPQITEKSQKGAQSDSQGTPKMILKSQKMHTWTSRCLLADPLNPPITQMITQGTQNGLSRSPECQIWVQKVTQFSNQPVSNCLLTRGRRQGAKPLNIYIYIYIYIYTRIFGPPFGRPRFFRLTFRPRFAKSRICLRNQTLKND